MIARMINYILWALFFCPVLLFAKSTYSDGNYSEAGGCSHMCMRCHMGSLNPAGTKLSLSVDKINVMPGDTITIRAIISGFPDLWNRGIALMADKYSLYTSRTPQEYGWQIIDNSNSFNYNFIKIQNQADTAFYWKLIAPLQPGRYRLAASVYFSDVSGKPSIQGTKRGDNSLEIIVSKSESSLPVNIPKVAGKYGNFVFLDFESEIDSSNVGIVLNNCKITDSTGSQIQILNAAITRDWKSLIIKTAKMTTGSLYTIAAKGLKSCSKTTSNPDNNIQIKFSMSSEKYRIYAEWSQDVTSNEIKQYDETEYIGRNFNEFYRTILVFYMPDNILDLLPIENIASAKLVLHMRESPSVTADSQLWAVNKLNPGTNWYDYVGNNQPVSTEWSGYNQVDPPIAVLKTNVSSINPDSISWDRTFSWDLTSDFRERFKKLGGSGTNTADYILRLKAADENVSSGGAGFYGSDAPLQDLAPYIEISKDSVLATDAVNENQTDCNGMPVVFPSPVNDLGYVKLNANNTAVTSAEILDIHGESIQQIIMSQSQPRNYFYFSASSISEGFYMIKINTSNGIKFAKIVVIH